MEMVGADQGQIAIMEAPDLEALLDSNHVLTCAVFRRVLWQQAGGYRDVDQGQFPGYVFEDWAFWVRLAALGARFRNLHHDPMLRYRVHPVSLSRGKNVPPMSRQRELVKQMNRDVLQSTPDIVLRSRQTASIRISGTPVAAQAPVILDRSPPNPRPPTLGARNAIHDPWGCGKCFSAAGVAHLVQIGWRVIITTSIDPGTEQGDTTPLFERHTAEIFHLPRCYPRELWEDFLNHLGTVPPGGRGLDRGKRLRVHDCAPRHLRAIHPELGQVVDLLFQHR